MKPLLLAFSSLLILAGCTSNASTQPGSAESLTGRWFSRTQEIPIPAGTAVRVRVIESLSTKTHRAGDAFSATLDAPVMIGQKTVLPKGTTFRGHITAAAPSGRLKGRASLVLQLDSLALNGQTYPIATHSVSRRSGNHKKRNWLFIGGGSGTGAAIGAIASGGTGALIGAGAGAAAGTTGALLTGRKNVTLPSESLVTFSLRQPVQVKVAK